MLRRLIVLVLLTNFFSCSLEIGLFSSTTNENENLIKKFFPEEEGPIYLYGKDSTSHQGTSGTFNLTHQTLNNQPVYYGRLYTSPEDFKNVFLYWGNYANSLGNNGNKSLYTCWTVNEVLNFTGPNTENLLTSENCLPETHLTPPTNSISDVNFVAKNENITSMYAKSRCRNKYDLFVVKGYDSYTYELVTSTLFNGAPIWRRSDGYCYLYWFIENASGNRAWVMQCAEKPSGNWQAEGHAIDSWNKPEFFNSYPWDKAFTNHAVVTRNFDLKVTSKPYGLTNVIFTLTTTFNDAPVWSFGRECFIFWFAKLIWVLQCSPMTAIWAARDSAKNSQGLPDYSTILPWSSNAGWDSTSVLKVQKRCY